MPKPAKPAAKPAKPAAKPAKPAKPAKGAKGEEAARKRADAIRAKYAKSIWRAMKSDTQKKKKKEKKKDLDDDLDYSFDSHDVEDEALDGNESGWQRVVNHRGCEEMEFLLQVRGEEDAWKSIQELHQEGRTWLVMDYADTRCSEPARVQAALDSVQMVKKPAPPRK